jgi:hypothetical protein
MIAPRVDVAHFRRHGWRRVAGAVPKRLCHALLDVMA